MLAIGGLALVAVVLMGVAYVGTETDRADLQRQAANLDALRGIDQRLSDALDEEQSSIDDYLLSGATDPLTRFSLASLDESNAASDMMAASSGLPELQTAVVRVTAASAEWLSTFAHPAMSAVRSGDPTALQPFTTGSAAEQQPIHDALTGITDEFGRMASDIAARNDALTAMRTFVVLFGLAVAFVASVLGMWLVRRYGRATDLDATRAGIVNRFTEVTAFAPDDTEVSRSSLEALALLVQPDAAVIHVYNRSGDRGIPEATLGDTVGEILPLNALSHCAGTVRGSLFVTSDETAPLSVHCPVYPVGVGTLACVPLMSGDSIGTVHLYWKRPHALPLEMRATVMRVADHAALAIGNRRLLAALQGQASTDPRTGLANSRAFDAALEEALLARTADEPIAILMIDIDNFKDFNDRHGHPAGDHALRAFANVLQSCMRDGDIAARYGGDEFAVLLPHVDDTTALAIAERVRARTESTFISLAPGATDRITVSVGLATAPSQALDRVTLLRIADESLYGAKQAGRNRVVFLGDASGGAGRDRAKRVKKPIDVALGGHVIDDAGAQPSRAA